MEAHDRCVESATQRLGLCCQIGSAGLDSIDECESNRLFWSVVRKATNIRGDALKESTYINDSFDLAKYSSNRLANEGDGLEEPGFADQDVEKRLVDTNEL